jgi:hypothetical protein
VAFPNQHNVLVIFGETEMAGEVDIWQTRLRVGTNSGAGGWEATGGKEAALNDIGTDLTTWWNAISSRFDNSTKMVGFKFNRVGTDGKYLSLEESNTRLFGTNGLGLPGTNAAGPLPPQIAVVLTLRTAAQRGYASKGRMFLPTPGAATLDPNGRLAVAAADNFRTATATLFTNLNNWPMIDSALDPGEVRIMSSVAAGMSRQVTEIRCGTRYDTQRRRANRFTERPVGASPVT